jgi:hypothetical protein
MGLYYDHHGVGCIMQLLFSCCCHFGTGSAPVGQLLVNCGCFKTYCDCDQHLVQVSQQVASTHDEFSHLLYRQKVMGCVSLLSKTSLTLLQHAVTNLHAAPHTAAADVAAEPLPPA